MRTTIHESIDTDNPAMPDISGVTPRAADLHLADSAITAKIQHYPEDAKEPTLWLASYLRERCAGRRDILVDQVRKHGFKGSTFSENYFYRILTGRYFQPDPRKPGKVLGSVANFLQVTDALRASVLLHERAGKPPFVETSTWVRIRDYLDAKRAPENVCKFGVIIGPTGSQKTENVKHYCHLNNHGTCVHLEAPEKPNMSTFLTDLTSRYGGALHCNNAVKMREIARSVTDKKLIAIDNVQRMYIPGQGGNQPIFNYLQKLQDDTGCTIILIFAEIHSDFLTRGLEQGYFEQFEGRAGGRETFLVLDDYAPREDLEAFADAYGLKATTAAMRYLEKLSRKPGRIRIVCDALQQGRRIAEDRGEKLTIQHVAEARGENLAE